MRENEEKEKKEVLIVRSQEDKKNPNKRNILFGISYPGRIILTLYSFHGLFFIYNIIIQYVILIPGLLFEINNTFLLAFLSFIYVCFALSTTNILVIPTYIFLTFPFIRYPNPFDHIISFIYIFQEIKYDQNEIDLKASTKVINTIINIIIIIIEIFYIIGLLLGYGSVTIKVKDITKVIILFIMYLYFLIIILCYCLLSVYLIVNIIFKNCSKLCKENFGKNMINQINEYFKEKPGIPDINMISYVITPFVMKNYKKSENEIKNKIKIENESENEKEIIDNNKECYYEDICFSLGIFIKIFLIPVSLIGFILIFINIVKMDLLSTILFIILFFVMSTLSISLNFPCCYRNRKTFGHFCFPKYYIDVKHPLILSITRFLFDLIIALVAILLLILFYKVKDEDDPIDMHKFDNLIPSNETIDSKSLLLPSICYSSIHNIPLILYIPFINDAYDYNTDHSKEEEAGPFQDSYLQIKKYRDLFYNDDYEIKVGGNLIDEEFTKQKGVKMVRYDVKNKKNEITILSIKGTTYKKDMYLDFQLYFSSVLLNLLSTFSILSPKDSSTFRFIEYSLSIPYRIFFNALFADEYLKKLCDAFDNYQKSFYKNVVIVGHSLGGGLAKLLGRLKNKQAISLSGPGVNAFHSLWEYEGQSENFEISVIDLVPDMDLVPRVETSGGTIYRIICKKGVAQCHKSVNSLCEVLIMCRNPNYKVYCKEMSKLDENDVKDIYESSKLN